MVSDVRGEGRSLGSAVCPSVLPPHLILSPHTPHPSSLASCLTLTSLTPFTPLSRGTRGEVDEGKNRTVEARSGGAGH